MTHSAAKPVQAKVKERRHPLVHFVLILGSIVMIFPFIWMILTSFKSIGESILIPPTILPQKWLIDNYKEVLRTLPNSLVLSNP